MNIGLFAGQLSGFHLSAGLVSPASFETPNVIVKLERSPGIVTVTLDGDRVVTFAPDDEVIVALEVSAETIEGFARFLAETQWTTAGTEWRYDRLPWAKQRTWRETAEKAIRQGATPTTGWG
ncbi:hypothetical protein ACFVAJ_17820 [Agromyces sp. NPDC057679]|uniref:hypothetical protein n=1 Tax=Agromyces sp. NPDC057679 TaxID=3346207 RepID=UPI00367323ED